MSDAINKTLIMASADASENPLAFDGDERKLTIIFGTFATLIALLGLVFAALTWYTPRRRLSAHHSRSSNDPSLDLDLESNTSRHAALRVVNTTTTPIETRYVIINTTDTEVADTDIAPTSSSHNRPTSPSSANVLPRTDLEPVVTTLPRLARPEKASVVCKTTNAMSS